MASITLDKLDIGGISMEINEKVLHELIKASFKGVVRCNVNLSEWQRQRMCNNIDEAAKIADFLLTMIRQTGSQSIYFSR